MAIYIYRTVDGSLYSYCPHDTDPTASDATLAAQGMAKKTGLAQLNGTNHWDAPTLSVVANPVFKSTPLTLDFWKRFLQQEREDLHNMYQTGTQLQKNKIGAFLQYINAAGSVDCNDPYIQSSVQLLESNGILAAGRAAQILV